MSNEDQFQPSAEMIYIHNNQPWVTFTPCWAMFGCKAVLTAEVKAGEQAIQEAGNLSPHIWQIGGPEVCLETLEIPTVPWRQKQG